MASTAVPMAVADSRHSTWREGLVAGFIGATGVALWLLVVDLVSGRPFYTPTVLGGGLFSLIGANVSPTESMMGYTVFHYAAFIAIGVAAVSAIHGARTHPSVLALVLLLFAVAELGFYGLTALLAESRLGDLAWYQVGVANLIATVLMGTYLWRRHAHLRHDFNSGMVGDEAHDAPTQ